MDGRRSNFFVGHGHICILDATVATGVRNGRAATAPSVPGPDALPDERRELTTRQFSRLKL
jgi:hypothetical protein